MAMSKLRILTVHNRYLYKGGEDIVQATEASLLRAYGHEVMEYFDSNEELVEISNARKVADLIWSRRTIEKVTPLLLEFKPDIVHCHNIHYRVSVSIYWLCKRLKVPVVQTLHNFRLGCAQARFFRDGKPCEQCLQTWLRHLPSIYHRCFQRSALKSLALSTSTWLHYWDGTYSDAVNTYISLSEFASKLHVKLGIPIKKIVIKPNCVYPDPGIGPGNGDFCLFVGRLEEDKGLRTVIKAAGMVDVPIWIVGEGPMELEVRDAETQFHNVLYLGAMPKERMLDVMKAARFLLFPSIAYENFGLTMIEAFSVGLPVIASRLGSAIDIVRDSVTGIHFTSGSAASLAEAITRLWNDDRARTEMRKAARAEYLAKYTGEANVDRLLGIYERTIALTKEGKT
jgi:glycosyltransferase involved in cell wall biosynthesis